MDIVERRIGVTGWIDTLLVARGMVRRVPAPDRQIEATGERYRIVDHDDLLMLRTPERQGVVETERDLIRRAPLQRQPRQWFALTGIKDGIVPDGNVIAYRSFSSQ